MNLDTTERCTGPPKAYPSRQHRTRTLSGPDRRGGMDRVRNSNDRWQAMQAQRQVEFRRIERESAKQVESDRLLKQLANMIAATVNPTFTPDETTHDETRPAEGLSIARLETSPPIPSPAFSQRY
jgi:hypothetical protein